MRTYSVNSPQAAARLLAMALVADGNYALSEIRALDRLDAARQLGLPPQDLKAVIDAFCEDLLLGAHGEWLGSSQLDAATRQALLAEVTDPGLRETIVALCEAVVEADGHLAEGETAMLDSLTHAWRKMPETHQNFERVLP
ncbi:TerB family tellurite resistance protein [Hydrogenophaga sp.]|jgi:uncharacterized tellurite resistance protein B-like protein|uniref:tellurite resistance TerB family protein n=1 Tax=Hydrogenophaga sp. TaxID=1904254 RepID=UPI002730A8CD|nr:TerB family tellurite resistance protein [Hydrogenophaga sp.]MDP1782395.1 TerB family tellurite resistance protein [Hydrogenophaga sp.]MDP2073880.1 TerB family tellurite resistance protein [Hydrogenophaga sp.]MDP3107338.1 TerB family tellurite resistance protein [Hydrogenophaga sp.]MDP3349921.1 TerB family tellurite resistance protein [Hydrogenophaga sp.]